MTSKKGNCNGKGKDKGKDNGNGKDDSKDNRYVNGNSNGNCDDSGCLGQARRVPPSLVRVSMIWVDQVASSSSRRVRSCDWKTVRTRSE